jgi:6-pyruvoyltetrahydropterin/6-carboxytetrahydropterin synthase
VEVTVAGEPNHGTGYVMDLKKLSRLLNDEVIEKVDHKHLNYDVDFLKGIIPTAENLAISFWKILCPKITEGRLYSVRVYESEKNYVEYRGE